MKIIILIMFMRILASLSAHRRFQKSCQHAVADYFGSFREFPADSSLECSLYCVKVDRCLGFQYKESVCKLVSFFWEDDIISILNLELSNCFVDIMSVQSDYILNQQLNLSFKFYGTPMIRSDASQQCQHDGGILITVDSQAKNDFVNQVKGLKYANVYIGASDIAKEGDFRWEDGSPVVYDDFFSEQPNNYDGGYPTKVADCVVFGLQWEDVYCGRSYPFICQMTNN